MILTQQEIDSCREFFGNYTLDKKDTIDMWEMKEVLKCI